MDLNNDEPSKRSATGSGLFALWLAVGTNA